MDRYCEKGYVQLVLIDGLVWLISSLDWKQVKATDPCVQHVRDQNTCKACFV